MGIQDVELDWTTIYCDNTTPVFLPVTGYTSAAGLSKARATLELRGRYGSIQAKAAMQFADVEDAPGTVVEFTDAIASNTTLFPNSTGWVSVASTAEDSQLARLGYHVSNTAGSSLSMARIAAKVQIVVE